jgi:hypothetical protein
MRNAEQAMPFARTEELVVKELPEEVLVYDSISYKAYCLNRSSALVWKQCDGKTTVAEATRLLEKELQTPICEDVVWLALRQLDESRLLADKLPKPGIEGMARREVMRKLAMAAALPLVLSIAVLPASAAGSCAPLGQPCSPSLPCCPAPNVVCASICILE